jgi:LytS/YehU family sensor histidine kinase
MLFEFLYLPVRVLGVYLNWFFLIPLFLYKNRFLTYFLMLISMLFILAIAQRYLVVYWGYPVLFPEWMTQPTHPLVFFRVVQVVVMIISPVAISTGIKIFLESFDQKSKAKQLEIENREAELKYLKAQINPNFLFNTLNNLYGLSIEKSKKTPGLILKLADFLNYSLYESRIEKIAVGREIQLLKNYVELESDRYEDRVSLTWDLDENTFDLQIASLLFMPLVENAFKHGVREEVDKAHVHIKLIMKEDWLFFEVINSLPFSEQINTASGLGLANLRCRLELLYPNKHLLETYQEKNQFTALLKIRIDE